jgi:hypothetical protein
MTSLTVAAQVEALRKVAFDAIEEWNAGHPSRLRGHKERAAVYVTHVYADGSDVASFAITVECTLAGTGPLTFHGPDLATVAEHARLTLEHRIETELAHRAEREYDDAFDRRYGIAV